MLHLSFQFPIVNFLKPSFSMTLLINPICNIFLPNIIVQLFHLIFLDHEELNIIIGHYILQIHNLLRNMKFYYINMKHFNPLTNYILQYHQFLYTYIHMYFLQNNMIMVFLHTFINLLNMENHMMFIFQ